MKVLTMCSLSALLLSAPAFAQTYGQNYGGYGQGALGGYGQNGYGQRDNSQSYGRSDARMSPELQSVIDNIRDAAGRAPRAAQRNNPEFFQELDALLAAPAAGSGSTRQSSSAGQSGGSQQTSPELQPVVQDIRQISDRAPRAAQSQNPAFFERLDALLDRYSGGGTGQTVWEDAFTDGDYTSNPNWTVRSGTWTVQNGRLTSNVPLPAQPGQKQSRREQITGLVGALGAASGYQVPGGLLGTGPAVITMDQTLSNAFEIRMSVADLGQGGTFAAGVYDQGQNLPGYRLVYISGDQPSLSLVRASDRGTGQIAQTASRSVQLNPNPREIMWTRDARGGMQVSVDGRRVLSGRDSTFSGPWAGFALINQGGQFAVASASARGDAMADNSSRYSPY